MTPDKEKDGFRRYGAWAGYPNGYRENMDFCAEQIPERHGYRFFQCGRKRGHGPNGEYCKQHAKRYDCKAL